MNTYLLRLSACLFLCVSLNTFAALSIRDLDGDWFNGHEGVYDDVLDITWLADANYVNTSGYSTMVAGAINWSEAQLFVNQLSLGDYNEWRLPSVGSSPSTGSNIASGEIGYMIFTNLENSSDPAYQELQNPNASFTNSGYGSTIESFSNLSFDGYSSYWYDEDNIYSYDMDRAWSFYTWSGYQDFNYKHNRAYVWPVHDGDIGASAVPLPAGIYLFASGLVGLGLVRRSNFK